MLALTPYFIPSSTRVGALNVPSVGDSPNSPAGPETSSPVLHASSITGGMVLCTWVGLTHAAANSALLTSPSAVTVNAHVVAGVANSV